MQGALAIKINNVQYVSHSFDMTPDISKATLYDIDKIELVKQVAERFEDKFDYECGIECKVVRLTFTEEEIL